MCTQKDTTNNRSNLFIKICFGIVTLCIIGLTIIAGYILISNHTSQRISNSNIHDINTSYKKISKGIEAQNAIYHNSDSTGITVINDDEHSVYNTELNLSDASSLLDSIIDNLTLAVNAVNNVLTSGSILISILTLFIALIGIFAYHDLKGDVKEYEKKVESKIKGFKTVIETFNKDINDKLLKIDSFNDLTTNQTRYFNKSIDFLYIVSSLLTENAGNEKLRDKLFHDYYINTLYRNEFDPDSDESRALLHYKKAAIEYLKEKDKGTLDDIKDLEIVAKNEPNEEIRQKIYELIGIIRQNYS